MTAPEKSREDFSTIKRSLCTLVPDRGAFACDSVQDDTDRLFESEREQIARAGAIRRWEFSTGRRLGRAALAQIGYPPVALPGDSKRRPRWPEGAVGSISHTNSLCAVMVAPAQQVAALGLDIERVSDVSETLLPHISREDELDALSLQVPGTILPALIFSAREAVFKAYNPVTDKFLDFQDVRLSVDGDRFTAQILPPDLPRLFGQDRISGRFIVAGDLIISVVALLT